MLQTLKSFCIEMLRQAGYDELADWLNDAGQKAVKVVARVVARSIGLKGKVDKDAASEIEAIRRRPPVESDSATDDDSVAAIYLSLLNHIVAGGVAYPALVLDGFLHSTDCASLWKFERPGQDILLEISIDPFTKQPYIALRNSGVQIYLLDKLTPDSLAALNTLIGNDPDAELPALATQNRPRVENIYEHHLEALVPETVPAPTVRDRQRTRTVDKKLTLPIPGSHEGLRQLMDSLPAALVARATSAEALKRLARDFGKQP